MMAFECCKMCHQHSAAILAATHIHLLDDTHLHAASSWIDRAAHSCHMFPAEDVVVSTCCFAAAANSIRLAADSCPAANHKHLAVAAAEIPTHCDHCSIAAAVLPVLQP